MSTGQARHDSFKLQRAQGNELDGVYSHDDALRWIHSDEGAPDPGWCPAHGALRRAAWEFWQGTRQHKEVLGETDETATPLPNPTGQTLGPSSQHARLATAVAL